MPEGVLPGGPLIDEPGPFAGAEVPGGACADDILPEGDFAGGTLPWGGLAATPLMDEPPGLGAASLPEGDALPLVAAVRSTRVASPFAAREASADVFVAGLADTP